MFRKIRHFNLPHYINKFPENKSALIIDKGVSDFFKILSALIVMLGHYFAIKAQMGYDLNFIERCIRSQGGNIGVAIFFFLSGYGLMMSEMKSHLLLSQFFKKRFCKIYLPIILVTALWMPLGYNLTPPPYIADYQRLIHWVYGSCSMVH